MDEKKPIFVPNLGYLDKNQRQKAEEERQWREDYFMREEKERRSENRRGFVKGVMYWTFALSWLCVLGHKALEQSQQKINQRGIEDRVRVERGYVSPNPRVIILERTGTSENPTTTATHRGTNYFFKIGEKGVPYFESYNDKGLEGK